jgi:putative endopeptidase
MRHGAMLPAVQAGSFQVFMTSTVNYQIILLASLFVSLATCPVPSVAGSEQSSSTRFVRAQDDLYRAANGAWLDKAEIPADKDEIYAADLPATINARVHEIVDELHKRPQSGATLGRKIVDYYDGFMDTAAIDRAGMAPIRPLLAQIDAIDSAAGLARWQGQAQGLLKTPIWLWGGFADFKDPGVNRVLAMQGGLGLPGRDYYLQPDPRMAQARAAYLVYLAELARLSGEPLPAEAAQRVMALETRLAQAHVPADEAMNPAQARTLDAPQLARMAPGFDWAAYLHGAAIPDGGSVNVMQPASVVAIARLSGELPLADWKLYFRLRSLDVAAPVLPEPFRTAHFSFRGKALGGQSQAAARSERAIDALTEALGDGLSALYMERYFPPEHKARVEHMVGQILATARQAVENIAWMGRQARAEALAKISACKARVGYPAIWRDYSSLDIRAGDALGNRSRARRHEWLRLAALSGTRVDRRLWTMSALEPNAYYDPMLNEINLPAGILQAPFFNAAAGDAENYGGIGVLIAHEISHAFDSTGSQFDSRGVQRDWWSAADHGAFAAFSARLAARFDTYEALPGIHVNGKLTLPENLADLMGLQLAYRAYRNTPGERAPGQAAQAVDGRHGEARFFLAYARQWAVKRRDERLLQLLSSDPHAPAEWRANSPAMDVDGFHEAFGTRPGDRMYLPPEDRLRVW